MPTFTTQRADLQAVGPIVDVQITISTTAETSLRQQNQPVPAPISAAALIDTGAGRTVIQEELAAQLGLRPVGVVHVHTASDTDVSCYEYAVRLVFPNHTTYEVTVLGTPLRRQPVQCLIGRDILAHGVLVYIGHANLFSLSF